MQEKANPLPRSLVDFHVHLFPDRMFEAIWQAFIKDYGWEVIHKLYWREALDYLRERGVGPVVYSNYAHREGVAQGLNEFNLEVVESTEDVFVFAAFHPDDPGALARMERLFQNPKVLGVKLQLLVQRFYPHDSRLFPLYELIMEAGKRVLFHVGTGPVGNPFVGAEHFARIMDRYPRLAVNVAHMGGLEYAEFFAMLDRYEFMAMDTSFSFLPGLSFNLGAGALVEKMDRIVYGSDFPNLILPRETEIDRLLEMDLPEAFYRKVFRDNGLALIEGASRGIPV